MKRRRSSILILIGVLLGTTSNCAPVPSLPRLNKPNIVEMQANAYFGIEENLGSVELDIPLRWHFRSEFPKDIDYFTFRVTFSSDREGPYEFYWVHPLPDNIATGFTKIDGPCPMEANIEALAIMQAESLKFTGNENGPAIFSNDLAQQVALGPGLMYWETCNPEFLPEPRDDKGNYLKNFTFIVNADKIPGKLRVRLLGDESTQPSLFNDITMVHSPFHMAVIGDSVMWGQGLNEEDKLWVQVHDQIAEETDQIVRSRNFAHSGAVVGEGSTNCTSNEDIDGEILRRSPNIHCQLDKIGADGVVEGESLPLERLDLLLMDGCINDVGATDIALGMNQAQDASSLRSLIEERCGHRMIELLRRVREEAPNARVILNGYFPILSLNSIAACSAQIVIGTISFSGATIVAFALSLGPGVVFAPNAFVQTGIGITGLAEGILAAFLADAEERSQQWVIESDELLDNVAIKINEEFSGRGVGSITFVSVSSEFGGHEAFVPIDPWLWNVDCLLNPEDPVASDRIADCAEFYEDDPNALFICERGSTFHPNVTGEATYVRLVIDKLRALSILPEEP